MRVLLIDDEEVILNILARLIKGCGHEVSSYLSVFSASNHLAQGERFDLVITDWSVLSDRWGGFQVFLELMSTYKIGMDSIVVFASDPGAVVKNMLSNLGICFFGKPEYKPLMQFIENCVAKSEP